MDTHSQVISDTIQKLDSLIDSVLKRGFDDIQSKVDDYSLLLSQYEFRNLVIYELYEAYIPPRRHEFELKIIGEIVDAVVKSNTTNFIATAVVSGVLGNLAYDIAKNLLMSVKAKLGRRNKRSSAFNEMLCDLELIQKFFTTRKEADLQEIATSLDIRPDRISPLLKMLGFKCRRHKKKQIWRRP